MAAPRFVVPTVDPEMYQRAFVCVGAAFALPMPFLALDIYLKSAEWFAPSGAMALFLVAFAQFSQLSHLQNKHFWNAERAKRGAPIQIMSETYRKLERWVFCAGLYGTAVWAYGDKLVELLLRAT